jgi:dihydroxy-acid dehydratase
VFLAAGHVASGKVTIAELTAMADVAVGGPGVCAGMGTANSMHIVCESLGMALPGSAPVRANSPKMMQFVRQAGARIVAMVWDDLKPRDILTADAFANAATVTLSLSASINTVKHLQAIAAEAQCPVDVYHLFASRAANVPLIAAIRPNGERLIEELEDAGGAAAVMKSLEPLLRGAALTVTGRSVADHLRNVTIKDPEVIRPLDNPLARRPSIIIVRGSLAPEGGIVKLGVADDRPLQFSGAANIYQSREEALEGLAKGEIKAGQVVVLRGMGVKGGPGMSMASALVFALDGADLSEHVAVVTDGQLSGLVNRGLVVGEVSPEAAAGGPLALVHNGDLIKIDVARATVDLDVPAAELAARRARLAPQPPAPERGWLAVYRETVQPLSKGAVLGP